MDYIADERRQASLDGNFEKFTPEQLAGIQAVAMDMWEPFANSVRAHLTDPYDKIVSDRYHLTGDLTGAVETVRSKRTGRWLRPVTRAWPVRSTSGCTRPRTCRPSRRPVRHAAGRRPAHRAGVGDQGEPAALLVL